MPVLARSRVTTLVGGAAAALLSSVLLAPPATADRTFPTATFDLTAVSGAPLRSGHVIDIHAEGPRVYAQERYHLTGALPGTEYLVVLNIFRDIDCDGASFVAALETDTFRTNRAGNGHGSATFRPADAAALAAQQAEYGLVWDVLRDGQVAYSTGCQVVALD